MLMDFLLYRSINLDMDSHSKQIQQSTKEKWQDGLTQGHYKIL